MKNTKLLGLALLSVLCLAGCKKTHVHDYSKIQSNQLVHWYICEADGEINEETQEPHTFGEWVVTTPAGCTTAGVKTRTCSVCHYSETGTVAALGHTTGDWQYDETNHWKVCSTCEEQVNKAAHNNKAEEVIDTTLFNVASAAYLPENATKGDVTITFARGTNIDEYPNNAPYEYNQPKYYTKDGVPSIRAYIGNTIKFSSDKSIVKIVATPASTSKLGGSDYGCLQYNGTALTAEGWTGSAKEVLFDVMGSVQFASFTITLENSRVENLVAATHVQEGSYDLVYICSDCGQEYNTEHKTIPALGHDDNLAWEGDAVATGNHWKTCSCGQIGLGQHEVDEENWTVKVPFTCVADGVEKNTCNVCGLEVTRVLPKPENAEHNYQHSDATQPSVDVNGVVTNGHIECQECTICHHFVDLQGEEFTNEAAYTVYGVVTVKTGDNYTVYTTLDAALAAAEKDSEVKLMKDVTLNAKFDVTKDMKLVLNGKTLSYNGIGLRVVEAATLTIDGTVDGSKVNASIQMASPAANFTAHNGNLVINGGTYTAPEAYPVCVVTNGTLGLGACNFTATNATFKSASDNAFQLPATGTNVFTNCTIEGATGIYAKAGSIKLVECTVKGTGAYAEPIANGNGSDATGDAIILDTTAGYAGNIKLEVIGGSIVSTNGYAIREHTNLAETYTTSIKVSDAELTGKISGNEFLPVKLSQAFVDDILDKTEGFECEINDREILLNGCLGFTADNAIAYMNKVFNNPTSTTAKSDEVIYVQAEITNYVSTYEYPNMFFKQSTGIEGAQLQTYKMEKAGRGLDTTVGKIAIVAGHYMVYVNKSKPTFQLCDSSSAATYKNPVMVYPYLETYEVTATGLNQDNGTATVAVKGGLEFIDTNKVYKGETVVVTATPASGYKPVITVNGTVSATNEVVVNENTTIAVTFEAVTMYNVSITNEENTKGTVTADKSSTYAGDTVTLTITPAEGYALDTIKLNNVAFTGNTFVMPEGNAVVTVTWKADTTKTDKVTGDMVKTALANKSGYQLWSGLTCTNSSNAVYSGTSNAGQQFIQIRTDKSNSGIVSTTSGGKVKSVTLKFNKSASAIEIYGSNVAYTSAENLYDDSAKGTLLGTLDKDGTFIITGSYSYIGIKSSNGARYLDYVEIVWDTAA